MNYNDRIKLIEAAVNKLQNKNSESELNELDFNDSKDLIELELLENDSINNQSRYAVRTTHN